jgi:hypothetical protein
MPQPPQLGLFMFDGLIGMFAVMFARRAIQNLTAACTA